MTACHGWRSKELPTRKSIVVIEMNLLPVFGVIEDIIVLDIDYYPVLAHAQQRGKVIGCGVRYM